MNRSKIDEAKTPVLFVELKSGQNGTLTPYPGQGVGQTWLGADGATVTMERGILKATRGLGNDLMGSYSSMPQWSKITNTKANYIRELSQMTGDNQIKKHIMNCSIKKNDKKEEINIWAVTFQVTKFEEICNYQDIKIKNTFYLDDLEIVRRSFQYHSETIGYITTERLDR